MSAPNQSHPDEQIGGFPARLGRKRLPNVKDFAPHTVFGAEVEGSSPTLTWSHQYGPLYALGRANEDVLHRVPDVPEAIVDEALIDAVRAHEADFPGQFRMIARHLVRLCWGPGADRRVVDSLEIELRVYAAVAVALATPAPVLFGRRHAPLRAVRNVGNGSPDLEAGPQAKLKARVVEELRRITPRRVSREALRKCLSVKNASLTAPLQELAEEGVIDRSQRGGIRLAVPLPVPAPWVGNGKG